MNIVQMLIPPDHKGTRPGTEMKPVGITIHNTDNEDPGADAKAHANYIFNFIPKSSKEKKSWHICVDDKFAYQSIPFNEIALHAGDGSGPGNRTTIAIEVCMNPECNFDKAVANCIDIIVSNILHPGIVPLTYPLPVYTHWYWSGKNCPSLILPWWADFIKMVEAAIAPEKLIRAQTDWLIRQEMKRLEE